MVALRFLLSLPALDLGATAVTQALFVRESSTVVMPQLSVLHGNGTVPTNAVAKGHTWKESGSTRRRAEK